MKYGCLGPQNKMKLQVVKIDKDTQYDEWIAFRRNGIGGSEVASILSMNQWKCAHEVYYQKLGLIPEMKEENGPMFMGNELEDLVASHFEYWEGDMESLIRNKRAGNRVRTLYKPKGYVINPDYPHLFFSPDRLELVQGDGGKSVVVRNNILDTDQVKRIIEIKTISGFAAKQYEDEFNPAYGIQVSSYLLGLGIGEGVLFTQKDGRDYNEQFVNWDDGIVDQIMRLTKTFWEKVLAGREALEKGGNYDQFAPEPDGTKAYENFLKERYRDPEEKTLHNPPDEIWNAAVAMKEFQERQKDVEEDVRLQKNILMEYMGNMTQLDFGVNGKITWRPNSKGSRTFLNLIKP